MTGALVTLLHRRADLRETMSDYLIHELERYERRPPRPHRHRRRSAVSNVVCTHLDQIAVRELPASVEGCEDCLRTGGKWLHLRICLTCGHVACCDDSPNRHATAHAHATSHPIIRSLEPGEDWNWCYVDQVAFLVDGIRGKTRIPPSPLLQ